MPVAALIEVRAETVPRVKECIKSMEYVMACYELMGRFNIGIIVEVKSEDALFDVVTQIRAIPGVEETRTHIVQDGFVF